METKEFEQKCCGGVKRHKKVFMFFIGIILLGIVGVCAAAVGWKIHEEKSKNNLANGNFSRSQVINNGGNKAYPVPVPVNQVDQFVLPQDAAKSGEIAITVSDIEVAKKAVADAATKNTGNIYETFISYASNTVKNGSIVVQIPVENFDATFTDLKKVGTQIIQEKTSQIAPVNYYAVPMMGSVQAGAAAPSAIAEPTIAPTDQQSAPSTVKPEIAIAPNPVQSQFSQNKGYIKVIFADYGQVNNAAGSIVERKGGSSIIGTGEFNNQTLERKMFVLIAIKLLFLIGILGLLLVIFIRMFRRIRGKKENIHRVHVVRQMPKTHRRVVKVQKKK